MEIYCLTQKLYLQLEFIEIKKLACKNSFLLLSKSFFKIQILVNIKSLICQKKNNQYHKKNNDSIWVLFLDIQAAIKNKLYTLSSQALSPPNKFKIGNTIMLDSIYLLDLIITDIKWIDPINCYVHYRLPLRENKVLILNQWSLSGSNR